MEFQGVFNNVIFSFFYLLINISLLCDGDFEIVFFFCLLGNVCGMDGFW